MRIVVILCVTSMLAAACASGGRAVAGQAAQIPAAPAASAAGDAMPADAQAAYELGLARAAAGDYAAAARAFDAATEANPRLAYAYYHAGLAYDRINRPDLTAIRFDMFLRLAPDAPERPQVESILRTMRGR